MNIIRHTQYHDEVLYLRRFEWAAQPGSGFSFDCDATGVVSVEKLAPEARRSYEMCLSGVHPLIDHGVEKHERTWREPAVGLCEDCGSEIELGQFTNTCRCGADYNGSGQRLAPREQWGCETGEHWTDCVGPFSGDDVGKGDY